MKAEEGYAMIDGEGNFYINSIRGTYHAVFEDMERTHSNWIGGARGQMHWHAAGYRVVKITIVWDENERK